MPLGIPAINAPRVPRSSRRLFVFAAFFTFAYALHTVAWTPIYRALSWLPLPLGQNALMAYTLHLFVVALTATVSPFLWGTVPATAAQNTLIQIGGIILIWAIILLQPYACAVLHAWFAKVTALVPVKRASWELSNQPRNP